MSIRSKSIVTVRVLSSSDFEKPKGLADAEKRDVGIAQSIELFIADHIRITAVGRKFKHIVTKTFNEIILASQKCGTTDIYIDGMEAFVDQLYPAQREVLFQIANIHDLDDLYLDASRCAEIIPDNTLI